MTNFKKKRISISAIFILLIAIGLFAIGVFTKTNSERKHIKVGDVNWWEIQSIDTVKFSRDVAREKANDPIFNAVIEKQVGLIAQTGATHVAIGTPYDEEFTPFMKKWVESARKNNISVWFRGNFSGWEGWFEYSKITRDEHAEKLEKFILSNKHLFQDGDIFTPCTECENGGPGDPRNTGDVEAHRDFLIREHELSKNAFEKIGKDVQTSFNSMNGDVASIVMDTKTTNSVGNIITIDHYVETPFKLASDVKVLGAKSEGKIVLGEFGAPIPDLHGNLSESEQAKWVGQAFEFISQNENVIGVNYWTGFGGSTMIWNNNYSPRKAVDVIEKYYNPEVMTGFVVDEIDRPVENAEVRLGPKVVRTNSNGEFTLPYVDKDAKLKINTEGYKDLVYEGSKTKDTVFKLERESESIIFKARRFFYNLINF